MGRKKKTADDDQIPLSETQNTALTGRSDVAEETIAENTKEFLKKIKVIEIKSAELVDQMFCNYKYKQTVGPNTTNTVSIKSEVPVHPDLVKGFRKLDAHLALICEEVDKALIGDINDIDHPPTRDKIQKFTVTRFQLDGDENNLQVVLSGLKELTTGDAIKLETPKIVVNNEYPFAVELSSTIEDCLTEVTEYMNGTKQAARNQLQMEFENAAGNKPVEEDL